MNTTGYLILIAALLIVAGLLLYARFVSRARENSLHHSPIEPVAPTKERGILDGMEKAEGSLPEQEFLEAAEADKAVSELTEPVSRDPAEESPEITFGESAVADAEVQAEEIEEENPAAPLEQIAVRRHESPREAGGEEEKNRKGEYLDELQEAAAGLAMLMRSSTVAKRSTPVVYAPDEESVAEVEKQLESGEVTAEMVLMEVADPAPAEPVTEEQEIGKLTATESIVEESIESGDTDRGDELVEAAPEAEVEAQLEAQAEVKSSISETSSKICVLELLGSEVCDQMEKIDSGLDALEELVESIESRLSALSLPGWESEEGVSPASDEEISVAA
jgi:hypothetical protein